jgi:hypothetical protein
MVCVQSNSNKISIGVSICIGIRAGIEHFAGVDVDITVGEYLQGPFEYS